MNSNDFRRLAAAGLSTEQIALVMEIIDAKDADRKASQRARWRKHMENKKNANVSECELTLANVPRERVTRVEDKTSNLDTEPQEQEERNARKRASPDSEFDAFWSKYPHKVGKPVAKAKFVAARKRASIDAIMAGLERYVAKTDDRPWCNPATWLHQDRWADQPATVIPLARGSPSKLAPVDHFRNLASELNGQDRSDRGVGGNWDDAPRLPLRTIEHHG